MAPVLISNCGNYKIGNRHVYKANPIKRPAGGPKPVDLEKLKREKLLKEARAKFDLEKKKEQEEERWYFDRELEQDIRKLAAVEDKPVEIVDSPKKPEPEKSILLSRAEEVQKILDSNCRIRKTSLESTSLKAQSLESPRSPGCDAPSSPPCDDESPSSPPRITSNATSVNKDPRQLSRTVPVQSVINAASSMLPNGVAPVANQDARLLSGTVLFQSVINTAPIQPAAYRDPRLAAFGMYRAAVPPQPAPPILQQNLMPSESGPVVKHVAINRDPRIAAANIHIQRPVMATAETVPMPGPRDPRRFASSSTGVYRDPRTAHVVAPQEPPRPAPVLPQITDPRDVYKTNVVASLAPAKPKRPPAPISNTLPGLLREPIGQMNSFNQENELFHRRSASSNSQPGSSHQTLRQRIVEQINNDSTPEPVGKNQPPRPFAREVNNETATTKSVVDKRVVDKELERDKKNHKSKSHNSSKSKGKDKEKDKTKKNDKDHKRSKSKSKSSKKPSSSSSSHSYSKKISESLHPYKIPRLSKIKTVETAASSSESDNNNKSNNSEEEQEIEQIAISSSSTTSPQDSPIGSPQVTTPEETQSEVSEDQQNDEQSRDSEATISNESPKPQESPAAPEEHVVTEQVAESSNASRERTPVAESESKDSEPELENIAGVTNSSKTLLVELVPSAVQNQRYEKRKPRKKSSPSQSRRKSSRLNPVIRVKEEPTVLPSNSTANEGSTPAPPSPPPPTTKSPEKEKSSENTPSATIPLPIMVKNESEQLLLEVGEAKIINAPFVEETIVKTEETFGDLQSLTNGESGADEVYSSITIEEVNGFICKSEEFLLDGKLYFIFSGILIFFTIKTFIFPYRTNHI